MVCVLFACASKEKKTEFDSSIVATEENEKQLEPTLNEAQKEEDERKEQLSSIAFVRTMHDFGEIKADETYTTSFELTNTGTKPLLIYDVKASCGCTVPKWNKNPLPPGGKDKITVNFHPKPQQLGVQEKSITVITNTNPGVDVLQIKSMVISKANK
jgi:hypothetical protein